MALNHHPATALADGEKAREEERCAAGFGGGD